MYILRVCMHACAACGWLLTFDSQLCYLILLIQLVQKLPYDMATNILRMSRRSLKILCLTTTKSCLMTTKEHNTLQRLWLPKSCNQMKKIRLWLQLRTHALQTAKRSRCCSDYPKAPARHPLPTLQRPPSASAQNRKPAPVAAPARPS